MFWSIILPYCYIFGMFLKGYGVKGEAWPKKFENHCPYDKLRIPIMAKYL